MNSTSVATSEGDFLGHPRGLFVLFFTEMWERFSYYGMRALLMLYLTKHFLFADDSAALIYGSYGSLVYAMPLLGGLIADRYLGYRKAVFFGAVLLVCGHFGMAFEGPTAVQTGSKVVQNSMYLQIFYLSLAFIIVGVGFLKANISTMVGQLYGENDPRRDGGFTIFYMGINVGAFVATLACAYLGETYGWRYGFGLAGIGMLFGLLVFQVYHRYLLGYGEPPKTAELDKLVLPGLNREWFLYFLGLVAIVGVWQLIQRTSELGLLLIILGVVIVSWMLWFSLSKCEPRERDRMIVMLILISVSVLFWALFEQAGSSLTLFTDRNVAMGNYFTAGMFQSLNPLFIIFLAPVFAWIWVKLSASGFEPTTPAKFGLGILQVGLGFAVLIYGVAQAGPDGKVSVVYLALMYFLHTTGELCLSPVGLSMVTKLSVQRVAAMMMGVWFLSSAFASYAGGLIAGAMAIEESSGAVVDPLTSLAIYAGVFEKLALVAIGLGILVLLISPILHKRMHGVH
ncbi:MAG: peptide MFS transporter [bacterium]|nr:peptide MFS transporter [Gammaproteobacteria bacterium]HIL97440.1 peptide MFS transporter [Pseudomonadales bacterium]